MRGLYVFALSFFVTAGMAESTSAEAANRNSLGLSEFRTPSRSLPQYLNYYTDQTFGSRVYRITDTPGARVPGTSSTWSQNARHRYSKISPWNCNGSLMLLTNKGKQNSKVFLDARTFKPLFDRRAPGSEFRWMPSNSHEMFYTSGNSVGIWNVVSDKRTIMKTFSNMEKVFIGPYEGNLSQNGKRVALLGDDGSRQWVIIYNIKKNTEVTRRRLDSSIKLDWLSISPKGDLLVMNGTFSGRDQTKVYKTSNFKRNFKLLQYWKDYGTPSHYDLAYDESGYQVAIGVAKTGRYDGRVIKRNLKTGNITPLTPKGYAWHTSGTSKWAPFADEVIAVRTDGSLKFERIAKMRSRRTDYRSEAHAAPSPDGRFVVWASNWNNRSGRPLGAFVARVSGVSNNEPAANCVVK